MEIFEAQTKVIIILANGLKITFDLRHCNNCVLCILSMRWKIPTVYAIKLFVNTCNVVNINSFSINCHKNSHATQYIVFYMYHLYLNGYRQIWIWCIWYEKRGIWLKAMNMYLQFWTLTLARGRIQHLLEKRIKHYSSKLLLYFRLLSFLHFWLD